METAAHLNAHLRPLVARYYDTGSEATLGQILQAIRPALVRYARGTLGLRDADRREDLAQDVLLGLVVDLRARRYTPGKSFVGYAFTCCHNRYLKYLRSASARITRPGADDDPYLLAGAAAATPADELPLHAEYAAEAAHTVAAATGAVLGLDPNARAAVVLHYYRGLPVPEAAAQLGVGEQLYRDRLSRGLAALRAWGQGHPHLSGEGYAWLPHLPTGDLFTEPLRLAG